jgi:hypothetical protein
MHQPNDNTIEISSVGATSPQVAAISFFGEINLQKSTHDPAHLQHQG